MLAYGNTQVVPLPTCIIAYIPKDVKDPQEDANSVVLPVYEGLDRTKHSKVCLTMSSSELSFSHTHAHTHTHSLTFSLFFSHTQALLIARDVWLTR